jgi:hypothetical protein
MLFECDLQSFSEASEFVIPLKCSLRAILDPGKSKVDVACSSLFETKVEQASSILDRSFVVSSLRADGHLQQFMREKDTLSYGTHEGRNEIALDYHGIVDKYLVNIVSQEQVELNLYLPWFPLMKLHERFGASYSVDLDGENSSDFELYTQQIGRVPLGRETSIERAFDICLIGGRPKGKARRGRLSVISFSRGDVSVLEENANDVLDFLEGLYGRTPWRNLIILETKRKTGGGYSREGLVCLQDERGPEQRRSENASKHSLSTYLAHEIAHQWWGIGLYARDDWLSEGLATYSQFLYLRDRFGAEESKRFLEKYLPKLSDCTNTTLSSAVPWDQESQTVSRLGGLFALLTLQSECHDFALHLKEFLLKRKGLKTSSQDFVEFFSEWIGRRKLSELIENKKVWSTKEIEDLIRSLSLRSG